MYLDFAFHLSAVLGCIDVCSAFLFSSDDAFACDRCHSLVAAGKYWGIARGDLGGQCGGFAHRQRKTCLVQGNLRGCHGDSADFGDAVQFYFDVGGAMFYCMNRSVLTDGGNRALAAFKSGDKPGGGLGC